jgi:hypothetical protein
MTTTSPAIGLALRRIFDDASQFPPGNLSLPDAIANHRRWRADAREPLVGRLLTPLARLNELCERLDPADDWELGVIVPADAEPGTEPEAVAASSATVTAIEMPVSARSEAWTAAFPAARLYLEGQADDVPAIAARHARAKIRCGGETVPSPEAVAAFIRACADAGLPLKATAGLHQPLRHGDAHGFLNVLVATARAIAGSSAEELRETLLATDLAALRLECNLNAARRLFEGFGTCSIEEPIDALTDLGVLHD